MAKKSSKKPSSIKNIVVKLTEQHIFEIEVDSAIFDDVFMEAATRAVEASKKYCGVHIRPVTECFEKKDANDRDKHWYYNSYWILVNASSFAKAEFLRTAFAKDRPGLDLSKFPIRSNVRPKPIKRAPKQQ